MKHILTPCVALFSILNATAQTTYTFEQTSVPYVPLAGASTCTFDGNGFDEINELDGQVFQLFGQPFTLVSPYNMAIGARGFLRFDRTSSVVVIDGLFADLLAVDSSSTVTYTLTGAPGSYLLTAQWTNWRMEEGPVGNYANWQISIDQATGIITVHTGPNSGGGLIFTDQTGPNCGVFHANSTFSQCLARVWVEGDPFDPTIDAASNFDFDGLHGFPPDGTLYRFVPSTLAGIAQEVPAPTFAAYIAADGLHVDLLSNSPEQELQLVDATGREVLRARVGNDGAVLSVNGLASGVHLLRTVNGSAASVKLVLP